MATNNSSIVLSTVKDLLETEKSELRRLIADESGNVNTNRTKRYNCRREIYRLTVITGLLSKVSPEALATLQKDKTFNEALLRIMNPEDGGTRVIVKEGDSILKLMQEYAGTRELAAKLEKAAEKIGCKVDLTTGKIVKI